MTSTSNASIANACALAASAALPDGQGFYRNKRGVLKDRVAAMVAAYLDGAKPTLYVAFPFGAGLSYAPHEGNTVSPAPRTYTNPAHAQLANPTGRLYACEDSSDSELEDHSQLTVVERVDAYPLTLLETRVPGVGCGAEGAVVLRDLGPHRNYDGHRWATHFRNDQCGGYHGGNYHSDFSAAVGDFAERSARELKMTAARFRPEDSPVDLSGGDPGYKLIAQDGPVMLTLEAAHRIEKKASFATITDAELYLDVSTTIDPVDLEAGRYGIEAPHGVGSDLDALQTARRLGYVGANAAAALVYLSKIDPDE